MMGYMRRVNVEQSDTNLGRRLGDLVWLLWLLFDAKCDLRRPRGKFGLIDIKCVSHRYAVRRSLTR